LTALDNINGLIGGPRTDPLLREALSRGGVGVWSWDLDKDRFSGDEVTRRLWGLQWRGDVPAERILDAVLPGDAERVRAAADAARDGQDEIELVFRVSRPGGEIRWTRVRAQASDETTGRRLTGVAIDITERMRVESALSTTENRPGAPRSSAGRSPSNGTPAPTRWSPPPPSRRSTGLPRTSR
jgi:PAS domain-containing protein